MNENSAIARGKVAMFAMLVACFALWGALNNMTDNLVPTFQKIFMMDQSRAGLVQVAFYGAYAVSAIFASILAEEFSYRKGVLAGLGIYIIGALLYIPACITQSFDLYFIAIFVVASGCSLLETSCNPYVVSLGSEETAVRRLNFAQMFNPVGSIMGILLAKEVILSHLDPSSAEARAKMASEALEKIVHGELFWVCVPYVGFCAIAVAIWCYFFRAKDDATMRTGADGARRLAMAGLFSFVPLTALYILFPQMNKVLWVICGMAGPLAYILIESGYRKTLFGLARRPRYVFGVVAQFFYVGVQIAVWTWMNAYCQQELGVEKDEAAGYYLVAIVLFVLCRFAATAAMKLVRPAVLMALFAVGALAATAGVMYLPSTVVFTVAGMPFSANVISLIAVSGFMSLMFPTIYGIALGGLDEKAVKLGAAGLIMAILGGAVITPWMANVFGNRASAFTSLVPGASSAWNASLELSSASLRAAFAIPAICFAVVLAYSLFNCRKKPA